MRLNAHQIRQFVTVYSQSSSDFPISKYYELEDLLQHTENDLQNLITAMVKDGNTRDVAHRLSVLRGHYVSYIKQVRDICQNIWAKFDTVSMVIGFLTIIITLLINIYFVKISRWYKNEIPDTVIVIVLMCLLYLAYAIFQSFFIGENLSAVMVYISAGTFIVAMVIVILKFDIEEPDLKSDILVKDKKPQHQSGDFLHIFLSSVLTLLYFMSFFSNSFVVHEDTMTVYFIQTLSWINCIDLIRQLTPKFETSQTEQKGKRHQKNQQVFDIMRFFTHPVMLVIFTTLLFNICVRFSPNFRVCREEQTSCTVSLFSVPLSSFSIEFESYKSRRYFFSTGCLLLFIFSTRRIMQKFGNLNGNASYVICVKYVFPTCAVSCVLYWALQALPQKVLDALPVWQQVSLARIVYLLIGCSFLPLIIKPLQIYVLPQRKNNISAKKSGSDNHDVIPQVYNQVKENMKKDKTEDMPPPIVCGLGTSCTSPFIYLVTLVILLLSLLLGDGLSPSLFLVVLSVYFFLEIITAKRLLSKHITDGKYKHCNSSSIENK